MAPLNIFFKVVAIFIYIIVLDVLYVSWTYCSFSFVKFVCSVKENNAEDKKR